MANYITNIITVTEGEFDLSSIKGFSDTIATPEDLNEVKHDSLISSVEAIFNDGLSEVKAHLTDLYRVYSSDENRTRLQEAIHNIMKHGHASWYGWRLDNWGCKWEMNITEADKEVLIFETAWACPIPWFKKFSETLPDGVTLRLEWADEDYGVNTGCILATNSSFEVNEDESYSEEAIERAKDILGDITWDNQQLNYR